MNIPRDAAIPLERMTWRDGQLLAARDLRDDQSYNDRLRELHIRYLHKTWGVVEGLNVVAPSASEVAVTPGYALDVDGRELLLPRVARLAAPGIAASTTMYLVISANTGASGCKAPIDLSGLCPGVKNPVRLDVGAISWKTVNEVRPGRDVLLARVLIAGGVLASAIDTSVRHRARSLAQPRMWSDATQSGSTGWADFMTAPYKNISATVDTSNAGFVITPAYFPRVAGASQATVSYILSASASSFTLVVQPTYEPGGAGSDAAKAEDEGWSIQWFAVELPPELLLFPFVTAGGLP
jgi:hypothetical protein